MIDIKLDNTDFKFLIESNLNSNIKNLITQYCVKEHDSFLLSIDKNTIDTVLDFLGGEFVQTGLKENDEPNATGIMIENIIDKFSRKIYN